MRGTGEHERKFRKVGLNFCTSPALGTGPGTPGLLSLHMHDVGDERWVFGMHTGRGTKRFRSHNGSEFVSERVTEGS